MKTAITLGLILLLCATTALASDYIVVAHTPSDVLAGVDYVAFMQAQHGLSFTGLALDDYDAAEHAGDFLVFIDGTQVAVKQGFPDNAIATATKGYFRGKGFTITTTIPDAAPQPEPTLYDETPGPAAPSCDDGCVYGDNCLAVGTRASGRYCASDRTLTEQRADGQICTEGYECGSSRCAGSVCTPLEETPPAPEPAPAPKQGFFARIFGLFARLFG